MRPYTIKHLRYVVAVKRYGSLARAAEMLSISVSSIREAVAVIEAALAIRLFQANPARGMTPTREGERFVALAEEALASFDALEQAAARIPQGCSKDMAIGVIGNAGTLVMPMIASLLAERIPHGHVHFQEAGSSELVEAVKAGRCAAAFSFNDFTHPALEFTPIFDTCLQVGLPPAHRLAGAVSVRLEDLENDPYVMLSAGGALPYYSGLFDHHGVTPAIRYTVETSELARGLIAAGLGYGVFNAYPLRRPGEGIVRARLETDYWCPSFGMICPAARSGGVYDVLREICRILRTRFDRPRGISSSQPHLSSAV